MNFAAYWITLLLCFVDQCGSLLCWHCIAENCDTNPEDNHRAEQRECLDGQICQKVVFSMQSDVDDTKYRSTVRSCSEECIPQNDYRNCSNDLYITRGCVNRACCSDSDLCNGQAPLHPRTIDSYSYGYGYHYYGLLVFGLKIVIGFHAVVKTLVS